MGLCDVTGAADDGGIVFLLKLPGRCAVADIGAAIVSGERADKGFGGFDGQSFEYPHMLNFDAAVYNEEYNPSTGAIEASADLKAADKR